jgi:hypothetical protein
VSIYPGLGYGLVKRLCNIIHRAQEEALLLVFGTRQPCYKYNRDFVCSLRCFQLGYDLETCHIRHEDVKQNEIRLMFDRQIQSLFPVSCRQNIIHRRQNAAQHIQIRLLVIHNQNGEIFLFFSHEK